jgi:hypothetical protein
MNDILIGELTEAIEDETLKDWWAKLDLPPEFSVNEFLVKTLEAASIAATKKNETLESGQKILGYPRAADGGIARTQSNQLFFPRTSSVISNIVISLDYATPVTGG